MPVEPNLKHLRERDPKFCLSYRSWLYPYFMKLQVGKVQLLKLNYSSIVVIAAVKWFIRRKSDESRSLMYIELDFVGCSLKYKSQIQKSFGFVGLWYLIIATFAFHFLSVLSCASVPIFVFDNNLQTSPV